MKVLFSFDDGTREDEKVVRLLKQYGMKDAIFFVPLQSWGFDHLRGYQDFKVGGHTQSHPLDLKLLSDLKLDIEIIHAKRLLDEAVGYKTEWFCYPRGRYDMRVMGTVMKAGYRFARTTKIGIVGDYFEMRGFHMFARKEYQGIDWIDYIEKVLNQHQRAPVVIHIWGHSWELEKYNEWLKFEELLDYINKLEYGL